MGEVCTKKNSKHSKLKSIQNRTVVEVLLIARKYRSVVGSVAVPTAEVRTVVG